MPSLQTLDFYGNRLTEISVDLAVPNVSHLTLSFNDFTVVRKKELEQFKNVEFLYLQLNNIEEIEAGSFDSMVNLEVLSLARNQIQTVDKNLFKG